MAAVPAAVGAARVEHARLDPGLSGVQPFFALVISFFLCIIKAINWRCYNFETMEVSVPIPNDQVVTVHYTLTDGDGNLLDTTYDEDPLEFISGGEQILAKLESEILAMPMKSKKKIMLRPDEAYGDYDAEDIQVVKRNELPDDIELEVGAELLAEVDEDEEAEEVSCFISKIDGDRITLDFNHPLAGKTLYFDVELIDVRPATAEELEHGHVHGEDCEE